LWEVIRKELEISGKQDVRSEHKQNWINHLERMDTTRLPKYALNYRPRGRKIVDALGKDGNASMPEHVTRPNPWRKMMMIFLVSLIFFSFMSSTANYFIFNLIFNFFYHDATAPPPSGSRPPYYRGFTITLGHTTLGRTTLEKRSARRRDLYLTTNNTHKRQTSMPPAGLEPTIPASERPQTHALDRAATGTCSFIITSPK
jgi:hypothetical protein